MNLYFDKDGQPIDLLGWAVLHKDKDYVIIKQEDVGIFWVSTVWIGLSMGLYNPPLIFETMVFSEEESDLVCERYSTEEQARKGHEQVVSDLKETLGEIETLTNGSEVTDGN